MDIARPDRSRQIRRRRVLLTAAALSVLVLITVALSQLQPAAPAVEKSAIWMDTVKRGEMLRQVRGNGTLVPEEIRWIPAPNAGRVERILILPGAAVQADTVLIELSNPELDQAAFDAEWQLKAAEAELSHLRVQLETERLTQEATAATLKSEFYLAQLEAEADAELAESGLVANLNLKTSQARAEELSSRYQLELKRLDMAQASVEARLAVQQAKLEQLRAQLDLKRRQVELLKVRAGIDGVLQTLGDREPLRVGQQISSGANLARVANPAHLKAEIRIAETQAKDIQLGQTATIDTRNGVVPGRVIRIDPAVQNGTVTVDVALEGALPRGARPDLTVDGVIELERLENVLYVGRPVHGQPNSTISVFRLTDQGKGAVRIPVSLGRSSVSTIEIVEGLQTGDQVILSDMSQWDGYDRLRIH